MSVLFKISVGQIWEKDNKYFHVPVQEKKLESGQFEVIRSYKDKLDRWTWVFPQEQTIWSLKDFITATLVEDK